MRVLVTGGAGFLGGHVVREIRQLGHVPIGTVRTAHEPGASDAGSETVRLLLEEDQSVVSALGRARPDSVVHCAAYGVDFRQQDLHTAIETNILGTMRLLLAAREAGVARFVHVGTAYEYGHHAGPIPEETPLQPRGAYAATKAAASILVIVEAANLGVSCVVVRPFSMYGPGEGAHKLVPQIIRASRDGAPLDLTAGEEVRDYLPVSDVARRIAWLVTLAEEFPASDVFNLCSGRAIRIRDFARQVADAAGGAELRFGTIPPRTGSPAHVVGNPGRWRAFCKAHNRSDLITIQSIETTVDRMVSEEH